MNHKNLYRNWAAKAALFILLLCAVGLTKSYAYDFSAICETGQILYFNITNASNHYVELTYPWFSNESPWQNYGKPTGNIILPESVNYNGTNYTVTSIGDYAFYDCFDMTGSLTIPNSVTSIGNYAFYNCSGFTGTLSIGNSVANIGSYSFYNCSGFTGNLFITNSVTGIGNFAFTGCNNFTGCLTIGTSVSGIGKSAFSGCSGLTEVQYNATNCYSLSCENNPFSSINGTISIGNNVTRIPSYMLFNCTGFTGTLIIPSSVTSIGDQAFSGCRGFTGDLVIPNSVRVIESYAFSDCHNFTGNLTIGSSVTTIYDGAFSGCGFTGKLTIGNSVTSIGNSVFDDNFTGVYFTGDIRQWCDISFAQYDSNPLRTVHNLYINNNLVTDLEIPDNVRTIKSYAFYGATCLTSLIIPNSITTIGNSAFSGCTGLSGNLDIPNSVTTIGNGAFYGCSGFTGSLIIPSSVTSIGGNAFYQCSSFSEVHFNANNYPDNNPYALHSPFLGCSGELIIGENVRRIPAYMFKETSFTGLTIPSSVTEIGADAFVDCRSFSEVHFNATNCVRLPNYNGYAAPPFRGCCGALFIGDNVEIINFGMFEQAGFTSLTIGNSVTEIGGYAFYQCPILTGTLTIPNSVTDIGMYAFAKCSRLSGNITIPNSVTYIGEKAFFESGWWNNKPDGVIYLDRCCLGYKGTVNTNTLQIAEDTRLIAAYAFKDKNMFTGSLTIPNSVTIIGGHAFSGCSGFTGNLTIGNSVTRIGYEAFYNCHGFTGNLVIPNSVVTIGDNAFYNCNHFTGNLVIPNSVTTIGEGAFYNCNGFKGNLTIGDSVISIGANAFAGDQSSNVSMGFTGELSIPNSVTTIGMFAFRNCTNFTGSLTIPDSVISIGGYAFNNCTGFTETLTISNSVTTIGQYAFTGCSGFEKCIVFGEIPPQVITDNNIPPGPCHYSPFDGSITYLIVPCGCKAIYESTDWGNWFANIEDACGPHGIAIGNISFNGGNVSTSVTSAYEGDEVRLYITPNPRMRLSSLTVCNANDLSQTVPVYLIGKSSSTYGFIMPSYDVTVKAIFVGGNAIDEDNTVAISVYPNPTKGNVTIETEDIKHVTISNMLGNVIYESDFKDNVLGYDFNKHNSGVYLIKIETGNGITTKRVVVTK